MTAMTQLFSALGRFMHQARARRVPQAVLAYIAMAWLTLGIADIVFDMAGLPEGSMKVLLGVLIVGFPIALGLAWMFDLGPQGLRLDKAGGNEVDGEQPHLAALLVIQPTGDRPDLPAGVRDILRCFRCRKISSEHAGLAAEFDSAQDALDAALRLLTAHDGATLRAGVALGELSRVHGRFSGPAMGDIHAVIRHAPPGGMAVTSALHYAALVRSHPELAQLMRPDTGRHEPGQAHAWMAEADQVARLAALRGLRRMSRSIPIDEAGHVPELAVPSGIDAAPAAPAAPRVGLAVMISIALVALVAALLWLAVPRPPAPPAEASIAVLPFKSLSSEPQDAHFAEGLADELLDALAGIGTLKVAARNATLALDTKGLDPRAVGARLNVATVLSANVRRLDSRIRISAQLSDTGSGFVRWSRTFDHELTDIFTVQREIAGEVVQALLGAMPEIEAPLTERLAITGDIGAYEAYLQGRRSLAHGSGEKALSAAIGFFGQALAADAEFARAQSGLCIAEVRRYETVRDTAALARAQAACDRAAAMDPELREVSLAQGQLLRVRGDNDGAAEAFTRALDSPPLRADAYIGLAGLEASAGRDALARQYFARAQAADPGYWRSYHALGNFHLLRGDPAAAIDAYRAAIGLAPDDATSPWNNLGALYLRQADFERAAEALQRSVEIEPTQSALSNLAAIRYYLGQYAEAARLLRRAAKTAPTDFRVLGNLADALAADTGHQAEALHFYRQAAELAEAWLQQPLRDAQSTAALAWYRANLGDADDARALARQAGNLAPDDTEVTVWLAQINARLGETGLARALIERARSNGVPARLLAALPALKHLGDDPSANTDS